MCDELEKSTTVACAAAVAYAIANVGWCLGLRLLGWEALKPQRRGRACRMLRISVASQSESCCQGRGRSSPPRRSVFAASGSRFLRSTL